MIEKTEYREPKTAWKDILPLKKWALYGVIVIALKLILIYFGIQIHNPF